MYLPWQRQETEEETGWELDGLFLHLVPQPLFSKPCDLSLSRPSLQEPGPLQKLKCASASSWQDQTLSMPVPSKQGWQTPGSWQPSAAEKVPRAAPALRPHGPPALKPAGQWQHSEGQAAASVRLDSGTARLPGAMGQQTQTCHSIACYPRHQHMQGVRETSGCFNTETQLGVQGEEYPFPSPHSFPS